MKRGTFVNKCLCVFIVAISFVIRADQYTDYNGITWTYSVTDPPSWESWYDGYATLTGASGASGDVIIPSSFSVTTGSYDENWTWVEKTKRYYVNAIQSGCFSGCTQILSVCIPDLLLASLNRDVFCGCTGLKAFKISGSLSGCYKARNGLLLHEWSEDSISLYMVPPGLTDVVVPDGICSIEANAFGGCNSLQSLTIPTSVSSIDSYSFCGGYLPSKIYFKPGDGTRVKSMFSDAGILVPDTAFVRESTCYNSLYQIVGDGSNEWQLDSSVSRNGGVSYRSAQIGDSESTYITFDADLSKGVSWWWKTSSENYFDKLICYINGSEYASISGETGWEKISLPTTYGACTIKIEYSKDGGSSSGEDCGWIDGLIEKDDSTWVCTKLQDLTLRIVGTKNLTGDVVVPSEKDGFAVSTIGAWLFECCSELTSVIISNGVTTIEPGSFADCVALDSISIPDTVVSIGTNVFRNTAILNDASPGLVFASNAIIGIKEPCPELVVIPSNTHVVADGAFAVSETLKKICTDVGDSSRVRNLLVNSGISFDNVAIVEKATVLFDANGGNCDVDSTSLVPGEVYGALPYPERDGFVFVGWYTDAVGGTIVDADTVSGESWGTQTLYAHWEIPIWLYSENSDNTVTITGCTCALKGTIVLPEMIDGKIVTGIGNSVLSGNKDIVGITLPDSIVRVSATAFKNTRYWNNSDNGLIICGKVLLGYKCAAAEYPTSLTIPEGVEVIANYAFCDSSMYKLASVTFPSTLTHIGKSAFSECGNIGALSFHSGLIEIDDEAFYGCSNLSTLNIPDTIKRIGRRAFYLTTDYNKSALSYISIHATDLVIEEEAFRYGGYGSSWTSAGIYLTGSGIKVGNRAFYGYEHGNGVTVDLSGVATIGNLAFAYAGYKSAYRYSKDGLYDIGSVELRISDQLQYASTNAFNWAAVGRVKVPDWDVVYGRSGWLNFLSERTSAGSPYEGFYCRLIVNDEYISSVKIPDGTVSIPEKAFKGLRIDHFEVPASVKTIGDQAFSGTRSTIQFHGQPPTCYGAPFTGCYSGGYTQSVELWRGETVDGKWNNLLISEGEVDDYSDALDAPGIVFTSTGTASWFVQAADVHDGTRALRSNSDIRNGVGLKCEISGPAELSYWWKLNKVRSGYAQNELRLYVDGSYVTNVTSNAVWEQMRLEVGSGVHKIAWQYSGVDHYCNYSDEAGFVDGVSVLYDVHFDIGEGHLINGNLNQKVKHGEFAVAPIVSAAAGRVFVGWSKDLQQITGPTTYAAQYREPTIAEVLNVSDNSKIQFVNDISSPWTVSDIAHDGVMSLKSGKIENGENCELVATFTGAGTLSFFWKASTEAYTSTAIDYGVLLVDDVEKARIGGEREWAEVVLEILGTNSHKVVWRYQKNEADFAGGDCVWVDEVSWLPVDPIPVIGADASEAEVAAALNGSADAKLTENIKDGTTYGQYRQWANKVKAKGGSSPAGAEAVKIAPNAWLSFALGSGTLIETPPTDGDLKVDAFEPATNTGKFDFTVSLQDIEIGSDATVDNLKKVFGLEGGTTLGEGGLSSENVDITFGTPVGGKVKFTAGPNEKNADAKTFFMKVKMSP